MESRTRASQAPGSARLDRGVEAIAAVARHGLPVSVLVTGLLGPDNVLTYALITLAMEVFTSVLTAFVFLAVHPPVLAAFAALNGIAVLVVSLRQRTEGARAAARRGVRALGRFYRYAGMAVVPSWVVLALAIHPRILPLVFCAAVVLTLAVRRWRTGGWDERWWAAPYPRQQIAAAVIVYAILAVQTLAPLERLDPRLERISKLPVYDLVVDAAGADLYFSYSASTMYGVGLRPDMPGPSSTADPLAGGSFGRVDLRHGAYRASAPLFVRNHRFALDVPGNRLIGFDIDLEAPKVVVLQLDTLELLWTEPLPNSDVVDVALGPGGVAFFVAEFHNRLYRLDLETRTWTDFPLGSPLGSAYDLKLVASEQALYVSQWGPFGMFANRVPLDDLDGGTYGFVGPWMTALAIDEAGDRIFVARPLHDRIDVLRLGTLERLYHFRCASLVREIAYDPRRDRLYALQFVPGGLEVFDATGGERIARHATPAFGRALLYDPTLDQLLLGSAAGVHRAPAAWLDGS